MTLKLSMCHRVLEYYQGYTNYDPGFCIYCLETIAALGLKDA